MSDIIDILKGINYCNKKEFDKMKSGTTYLIKKFSLYQPNLITLRLLQRLKIFEIYFKQRFASKFTEDLDVINKTQGICTVYKLKHTNTNLESEYKQRKKKRKIFKS